MIDLVMGGIALDNALAEHKLLILYTLNSAKLNLTRDQFSNVILECVYMNYFELQLYIDELVKAEFVRLEILNNKEFISITENGIQVLGMFMNRLKERKRTIIERYLKENINYLIKETTITHEISEGPKGSYLVNLKALENKDEILSINMNFPTKETAERAVANWKERSFDIYEMLYKELIKETKNSKKQSTK